jgi:hypothetical protein
MYACEIKYSFDTRNSKLPPISSSNNFAKTDEESNSGRQHQSSDPFFEINAALLQFPIIP